MSIETILFIPWPEAVGLGFHCGQDVVNILFYRDKCETDRMQINLSKCNIMCKHGIQCMRAKKSLNCFLPPDSCTT